jgi:hypothetical protein
VATDIGTNGGGLTRNGYPSVLESPTRPAMHDDARYLLLRGCPRSDREQKARGDSKGFR